MYTRLYMTCGQKSVRYTLRGEYDFENYYGEIEVRNSHLLTLTSDFEKSLEKCKAYISENNLSDIEFTIRKLDLDKAKTKESIDWAVFRVGKYTGKTLDEVITEHPAYIEYLAKSEKVASQLRPTLKLALEHHAYIAYLEDKKRKAEAYKAEFERRGLEFKANQDARQLAYELKKAEFAEKAAKSEFVGQPKDRMIELLTVISSVSFSHEIYGMSYIVTYTDCNGNLFVYKGSNPPSGEKGQSFLYKFTVKSHDLYKDNKQTTIQRMERLEYTVIQKISKREKEAA